MGGAAKAPGNVTPVAEANIWNDPHAADIVFAAKWPLILAPLDCTLPVVFSRAFIGEMKAAAPKFGGFLSKIALFYSDFYEGIYGMDGCVPHDVMALTCLTNPDFFTWERGTVGVATSSIAIGNTLYLPDGRHTVDPYWQGRPVHDVLTNTNPDAFRADYLKVLSTLG
jgi:inosine-uridine nucleoside N-ribohydrolase